MIAAKPTTYSNARFRSRLEAKWAAFFDLCGWRWEYEPLDLEGWVPDFSLISDSRILYIEVKPLEWLFDNNKNRNKLYNNANLKKVFSYVSGNPNIESEVLILGAYPVPCDFTRGGLGCMIGYNVIKGDSVGTPFIVERFVGSLLHYFDVARLKSHGTQLCRGPGGALDMSSETISAIWREASSFVQWNAKGQ